MAGSMGFTKPTKTAATPTTTPKQTETTTPVTMTYQLGFTSGPMT